MSGRTERIRSRAIWAVVLVAGALAWEASVAFGADSLYWSNLGGGAIRVGSLDGSGTASNLFTGENGPDGVVINPATGKIYWADNSSGAIRVGNLDGSGTASNLFTGENGPDGVAINPVTGKIYWANLVAGAIRVANLDGSGTAANLFTGENSPVGVAIDPATGKIYWANLSSGAIRVANLDGSGTAANLFTGEAAPIGVAINAAAGKIYWANNTTGAIRVANLNGAGTASNLFSGETGALGVAIDPTAGKIYWARSSTAAIRVANLDGSGTASNLFTGESGPAYLALLRSPAGTGAPQASGGAKLGSVLSCSQGSWADNILGAYFYRAPRSFTYQWARNGKDVAGANSSSFTASAGGSYTCRVTATNQAGSTSQTSAPHAVGPPNTKITKAKISQRKHKARFRFKAVGTATGFQCKLKLAHHRKPKAIFRRCSSPKTYRHLKPGRYTFKARAKGPGGTDPTPARKRFRINKG